VLRPLWRDVSDDLIQRATLFGTVRDCPVAFGTVVPILGFWSRNTEMANLKQAPYQFVWRGRDPFAWSGGVDGMGRSSVRAARLERVRSSA